MININKKNLFKSNFILSILCGIAATLIYGSNKELFYFYFIFVFLGCTSYYISLNDKSFNKDKSVLSYQAYVNSIYNLIIGIIVGFITTLLASFIPNEFELYTISINVVITTFILCSSRLFIPKKIANKLTPSNTCIKFIGCISYTYYNFLNVNYFNEYLKYSFFIENGIYIHPFFLMIFCFSIGFSLCVLHDTINKK